MVPSCRLFFSDGSKAEFQRMTGMTIKIVSPDGEVEYLNWVLIFEGSRHGKRSHVCVSCRGILETLSEMCNIFLQRND